MSKRITNLQESPCYKCGMMKNCSVKVAKTPDLKCIVDFMFGDADANFNFCPIYIALTAPDTEEIVDE